ncbi:DUF1801 domain-containing protein [Ekhidna sp.]|uniref:DUF1801 domain-containing protein n=1 Tax=Ekhidna sp. TaxID=2608089 RepID=UPI003BACFE1D
MLYDVNTPSEYLTELDEDWRKEKLMELRSILLGYKFTEGIRYKMLSYADDRGVVFQLNAQKNYVALYVGDASKVDPDGELLKGIDHGKGCLRFKKTTSLAETKIEAFIKNAVDKWKKGGDIDC